MLGGVDVDVPFAGRDVGTLCLSVTEPSTGLARLPVTGTRMPAFLPGSVGPWKCMAIAGPLSPE